MKSFGIFVLLFTSITANSFFLNQNSKDLLKLSTPENFANYLNERLADTDARFLPSRQCFDHVKRYVISLFGLRFWALQMFDSNAKIPSGLLKGNGGALGSFDECLNIESDADDKLGITRGKYCLGRIQLVNLTNFDLSPISSFKSPRLIDLSAETVSLPWGVCFPDACSASDIRFFHLLFFMRFSEEDCQTKSSQTVKLDDSDIAAIAIFGGIALLIVASTTYDIVTYYTQKDPGYRIVRSFSLFTNGLKIITLQQRDEITCIYGLRSLSIIALMGGLRYLTFIFAPLQNWIDLLNWILDKDKGFILESHICLDTFIFITGFLISYHYLKVTEEGKQFNILTYYFKRLIRLTPAFAAAILFHATLLRHIGSGPLWPQIRDVMLVDNCREHWWSALLYVQNYVNPGLTSLCLMQSWQLSADIQLFLLSPLILIPLKISPKFTLYGIGGLLACAIISPFLATWVYQLKAVFITNRSLADVDHFFNDYFFPTHTRASSWLIGFIFGYIIYHTKKKEIKLPTDKKLFKCLLVACWMIAIAVFPFCISIGRELTGTEYKWLPNALLISLTRPLWCLAIGWIIFACHSGYGGPINTFLSNPLFEVLSRITYGTYLTNISLIFLLTYQTRIGLEFNDFEAIYRILGDVPFCFALGLAWTLVFESPLVSLARLVFKKDEEDVMVKLKTN